MLNIGDTVKVIGKTLDGSGEEKELIPIGTICRVVGCYNDDKNRLIVGIKPEENSTYNLKYWYLASDVEKRHMEWVKDEQMKFAFQGGDFYAEDVVDTKIVR